MQILRMALSVIFVAASASGCGVRWRPIDPVPPRAILTPYAVGATRGGAELLSGPPGPTAVHNLEVPASLRVAAASSGRTLIVLPGRRTIASALGTQARETSLTPAEIFECSAPRAVRVRQMFLFTPVESTRWVRRQENGNWYFDFTLRPSLQSGTDTSGAFAYIAGTQGEIIGAPGEATFESAVRRVLAVRTSSSNGLIAQVDAVEVSNGVAARRVDAGAGRVSFDLVYPIADARRSRLPEFQDTSRFASLSKHPFYCEVERSRFRPEIAGRSLLRSPRPGALGQDTPSYVDIVLTDAFEDLDPPVVVVRKISRSDSGDLFDYAFDEAKTIGDPGYPEPIEKVVVFDSITPEQAARVGQLLAAAAAAPTRR